MALARAGHRVTIVDRADAALTRASFSNEGKIHLGFVYANDPSCRSSSLMLEAALAFGPILDDLAGEPLPWSRLAGVPFSYLVLGDSLVEPDRLLEAWARLDAKYRTHRADGKRSYVGTSPERILRTETRVAPGGAFSERVTCAVETSELALDMRAFQPCLRRALANTPNVMCRFGHDVQLVERAPTGFRVEGTSASGTWRLNAEAVVNCLWEGRLAIDRQLDLVPTRPWVYRLKYRLLGQLPPSLADLPSLTLVLGKFGDIVNYGDGRAYLSWYPACLRGWTGDLQVPDAWDQACHGVSTAAEETDIIRQSLDAFDTIVPGIGDTRIDSVAAGVIFSWGQTDIDDPSSELHRRDEIGPVAHEGYVTVNTGKLTTAPLFATRVVDLLR
jgi:hypothetical protein